MIGWLERLFGRRLKGLLGYHRTQNNTVFMNFTIGKRTVQITVSDNAVSAEGEIEI